MLTQSAFSVACYKLRENQIPVPRRATPTTAPNPITLLPTKHHGSALITSPLPSAQPHAPAESWAAAGTGQPCFPAGPPAALQPSQFVCVIVHPARSDDVSVTRANCPLPNRALVAMVTRFPVAGCDYWSTSNLCGKKIYLSAAFFFLFFLMGILQLFQKTAGRHVW